MMMINVWERRVVYSDSLDESVGVRRFFFDIRLL
jgi:hypothetical protein